MALLHVDISWMLEPWISPSEASLVRLASRRVGDKKGDAVSRPAVLVVGKAFWAYVIIISPGLPLQLDLGALGSDEIRVC